MAKPYRVGLCVKRADGAVYPTDDPKCWAELWNEHPNLVPDDRRWYEPIHPPDPRRKALADVTERIDYDALAFQMAALDVLVLSINAKAMPRTRSAVDGVIALLESLFDAHRGEGRYSRG